MSLGASHRLGDKAERTLGKSAAEHRPLAVRITVVNRKVRRRVDKIVMILARSSFKIPIWWPKMAPYDRKLKIATMGARLQEDDSRDDSCVYLARSNIRPRAKAGSIAPRRLLRAVVRCLRIDRW